MDYRSGTDISGSRVRRRGGGGVGGGRRGGPIAVGGIGGLILLVLTLLFGGNIGDVLGGGGGVAPQGEGQEQSQCRTAADIEQDRDCRWDAYDVALERHWSSAFESGFEPISALNLYSGQIATACGTGSSQMGPFYCPGDKAIYIDDEFMGSLLEQLGTTRSDAAELYIVGHEYGHHISNLTGDMEKARAGGNDTGPRSGAVRLELQADCYAGVFFKNTTQDPESPIEAVTQDDLNRIVDAARAVGDDHIQQQQGGRVVPESWTHGSSKMRQYWVAKGFESGDPATCDTFSTDDLGE
ncbi:neutral zinc metallopeptidase [Tessaracoccus sp. MC1865]|uniref:KPN_02809 family neutral zinc metallopeptidase n=1 Tax=Tessaracoccus sp. MC1865 TaxID=2760310 RepID=UPI001600C27B|nr:neutral zinc metallopeptidase [Tessaracoccus sp. MC1865]MBB1482404.1 neutral zinc metallopeptidase [Tessaracoccus sp. MC1865]QTO38135.1 neutral zinc metallopeptidase [Tessaracoccus sp. MC1865]